jgi:hypothetical protein
VAISDVMRVSRVAVKSVSVAEVRLLEEVEAEGVEREPASEAGTVRLASRRIPTGRMSSTGDSDLLRRYTGRLNQWDGSGCASTSKTDG